MGWVCGAYSWQLWQVVSISEISDGIGHACTTNSLGSPSVNDEYESIKQNWNFKQRGIGQLPDSWRPRRRGRFATKNPSPLGPTSSPAQYPKVISSLDVPFGRQSTRTKCQSAIDYHRLCMLTGRQLGTVDVTSGAAEGCKIMNILSPRKQCGCKACMTPLIEINVTRTRLRKNCRRGPCFLRCRFSSLYDVDQGVLQY